MDLSLSFYPDETWGEVLTADRTDPPFRPQKRRGSRREAPPQP